MKYRLDGREKTLSMGVYPAVSLQHARKLRDDARSMVANGEDPSEAKQEQKRLKREANGQTFKRIGAAFLEKQRKEGKSKATLDKTAYHLKLANRDFGKKPITAITAPMILRTLRKAETKGNYETAHRLRARIGSVFRYAVASGLAETDPTYALREPLSDLPGRTAQRLLTLWLSEHFCERLTSSRARRPRVSHCSF
jgi:integrase